MYFMQESNIGLNQSQSLKYLKIAKEAFERLCKQYNIHRDMVDGKFIFKFEDLDKIKSELEERRAIASLPSHKPVKQDDWNPTNDHIALELLGVYYKTSKQNICRLVNLNQFKFKKFFDKNKKLYYLKSEISQYFIYKGRKYAE